MLKTSEILYIYHQACALSAIQFNPNYYLIQKEMVWQDAENYCIDTCNSNLASIHSSDMFNSLLTLINNSTTGNIWIGLFDTNSNASVHEWQWSDGTSFDYGNTFKISPWLPGEPSFENQNCVNLWLNALDGVENWDWDNQYCTNGYQFICNSCYPKYHYLSENLVTWDKGVTFCDERCSSSTLAIIDDDMNNHYTKMQIQDNNAWIGLDDHPPLIWEDLETTFQTNAPFSSDIWGSSQPDDNIEGCIMMNATDDMRWYESDCDSEYNLYNLLCDNCDDINKYISYGTHFEVFYNFTGAVNICSQRFGTELASIHSDSDMTMAQQLCIIGIFQSTNCWIGLYQEESSDEWLWIDGTDFDYGVDVSGGVYPWQSNHPLSTDESQYVHIYPPRNHEWRSVNSLSMTDSVICNKPSEFHNGDWITIGDNSSWNFTDKNLVKYGFNSDNDSLIILSNRQFMNKNGALKIEYMFKLSNIGNYSDYAETGITLHTFDSICDYYYLGVRYSPSQQYLFLKDKASDIETGITFELDRLYTLAVTLSDHLNISINNQAPSLSEAVSDLANHRMSGIIGIKHTNAELYAKYLYASGVPIEITTTENIATLFSKCMSNTVDPSLTPTTDPTDSTTTEPFTINPSSAPTNDPTNESILETFVIYVVNITIILKDTPTINITSAIINLINKTANTIIAENEKECLEKDNFASRISSEYNITTKIISVSIQVCDQKTVQDLYTEYQENLERDLLALNVSANVSVSISDPDADESESLPKPKEDSILIAIVISGSVCFIFGVIGVGGYCKWKVNKMKEMEFNTGTIADQIKNQESPNSEIEMGNIDLEPQSSNTAISGFDEDTHNEDMYENVQTNGGLITQETKFGDDQEIASGNVREINDEELYIDGADIQTMDSTTRHDQQTEIMTKQGDV